MSRGWIKFETVTPDKPEIAILGRKLQISVAEALVAFIRILCWMDSMSADGIVPVLSPDDVDTLARAHPGTCTALASHEIGWIVISEGGLRFVNWDRHNGSNAKQRLYERERKRRQRKTSSIHPETNGTDDGTNDGTGVGPIEKRREEKKPPPPSSSATPMKCCIWAEVKADLIALKMGKATKAVEAAQYRGLTPVDVHALIAEWTAIGRLGVGALHDRIVGTIDVWPELEPDQKPKVDTALQQTLASRARTAKWKAEAEASRRHP
jgi:hypothetical protein